MRTQYSHCKARQSVASGHTYGWRAVPISLADKQQHLALSKEPSNQRGPLPIPVSPLKKLCSLRREHRRNGDMDPSALDCIQQLGQACGCDKQGWIRLNVLFRLFGLLGGPEGTLGADLRFRPVLWIKPPQPLTK